MSDTQTSDPTRQQEHRSAFPRAVVHKRILEVAESRPAASMAEIAEEVTGATTSLVEQVLEEYGDPGDAAGDDAPAATDAETVPADEEADREPTTDDTAMNDHQDDTDESTAGESTTDESTTDGPTTDEPVPEPDAVTEKQLETLRAIRERPTATQAALADRLGVSSATISQRVNGIDGFDWTTRRTFVDRFFARDGSREVPTADDEDATTPVEDETAADDENATATGPSPGDSEGAATARGDGGNAVPSDDDREAATAGEDATASAEPAATPSERSTVGNALDREGDRGTADAAAEFGQAADVPPGTSRSGDRADEPADSSAVAALADRVAELTARLETLERRLADGREHTVDPALAHKVIRACFESEQISAEEEIRLLEGILAADSTGVTPSADGPATDGSSAD